MSRSEPWTTADEWFAEFLAGLERSAARMRRLLKERVAIPEKVEAERDYDQATEQMRRMIAVERERWLAEQRSKTA